jgi:hypothetical protein
MRVSRKYSFTFETGENVRVSHFASKFELRTAYKLALLLQTVNQNGKKLSNFWYNH